MLRTWIQSSLHFLTHRPSIVLIRRIIYRFDNEQIMQVAGSLTFTTLLALVPLLTVILVVATAFPIFDDISAQLMAFVNSMIVPSGASAVADYLNQFKQQAGKITTFGIGMMAISALLLIQTIDQTFNRIWRVQRQRSWLVRLPVYLGLLIFGPILAGASLSASAYVFKIVAEGRLSATASSLQFLWQIIINTLILLLLYRIVPYCRVAWKHALLGALFTGILLEMAKWGFGIYIRNFNNYTLVYGAFAIVPIFLVWLHLLWLMILTGAVITVCAGEQE